MSKQETRSVHGLIIRLLALTLILAGCGRSSSQSNTAQAQSVKPAPPAQAPRVARPIVATALPNRLVLPTINIDIPVVELGWNSAERDGQIFSEWEVAEYAAGWHKNSAVVGDGGNVVMSGHNNILGSVFRELDQLKRGDEITVWAGNQPFEYRVDKVMIVPEKYASLEQRKDNAEWIGPFDDNRHTLVSCWPRDDNTHRIIVVAHAKG